MTRTLLIAPVTLATPHEIFPPSNAGPAGAEVAIILSSNASTISPFVPKSTSRDGFSSPSIPHASMPAAISAPTNAEIPGSNVTGMFERLSFRSARLTGVNGALPSPSQESPI